MNAGIVHQRRAGQARPLNGALETTMRITPLALPLCLIALIAGCDKKGHSGATPSSAHSSAAPEGMTSRTYKGVTFAYPKDWVVEESTDPVGQYVRPPAKDEPWQTNVF